MTCGDHEHLNTVCEDKSGTCQCVPDGTGCTASELQRCQSFGASSCTALITKGSGYRHAMCKWNLGMKACQDRLNACCPVDENCSGLPTTPDFNGNNPCSVRGNFACITMIENLTAPMACPLQGN